MSAPAPGYVFVSRTAPTSRLPSSAVNRIPSAFTRWASSNPEASATTMMTEKSCTAGADASVDAAPRTPPPASTADTPPARARPSRSPACAGAGRGQVGRRPQVRCPAQRCCPEFFGDEQQALGSGLRHHRNHGPGTSEHVDNRHTSGEPLAHRPGVEHALPGRDASRRNARAPTSAAQALRSLSVRPRYDGGPVVPDVA